MMIYIFQSTNPKDLEIKVNTLTSKIQQLPHAILQSQSEIEEEVKNSRRSYYCKKNFSDYNRVLRLTHASGEAVKIDSLPIARTN